MSVRLQEAEYKALQAAAQQEYTTMSGVLRKLIYIHLYGDGFDEMYSALVPEV